MKNSSFRRYCVWSVVLLCVMGGSIGCTVGPEPQSLSPATASHVVTGEIKFYAKPNLLLVKRVVVSIRDISVKKGRAPVIAQVESKGPFTFPMKFTIPYDPATIQPRPGGYALSARVYILNPELFSPGYGKECLYYMNDSRHSILTKAGDVQKDVAVSKRSCSTMPMQLGRSTVCKKCANAQAMAGMGECKRCGDGTRVIGVKLCRLCSKSLGRCRVCAARLEKQTPPEPTPNTPQ